MNVTIDQAIAIYAQACRAWYGSGKAVQVARRRGEELRNRGDSDGAEIWDKVATEIGARN